MTTCVTVYVPAVAHVMAVGFVAVDVAGVPLGKVHEYVAPPVPVFVKLYESLFTHWLPLYVNPAVGAPVAVTVAVVVAVHPFPLVTVTVYVPAPRPVNV